MFLIDHLDAAVHTLATTMNKPDGKLYWYNHCVCRLDETYVVLICSLPIRMDNEELC